jgi:hypothetical protein
LSVTLSAETAFHPTRALRRGWFVLTESPVLLWILAAGIVLVERFSGRIWNSLGDAVILRLEKSLPMADERFAWAVWESPGLHSQFIFWVTPLLLVLLALRSGFDLRAIRAHKRILETGSAEETERESSSVTWFSLFQFRLLAWGLVLGSLVLAFIPGLLVLWWGISGLSPVLSVFGLFLMLLFGLPVWVYVSLGLYTGDRLMVYEGIGPVQAMEAAWDLARGNRMAFLVFRMVSLGYKVAGILIGFLLCGVGVLVTWPLVKAVSEAALSEAMLVMRNGEESPPTWKMLLTHEQAP